MKKKLAECLVFWGILLVIFPASSSAIKETDIIWGQPEPIDEIIEFMDDVNNNCDCAGRIAVTDDEKRMIITLKNCKGGKGDYDLWMFTRDSKDNPWSNGVNLNDTSSASTNGDINTDTNDHSPTIRGDGKVLIWESNRLGSKAGYNIWQSIWDDGEEKWGPATELSDINSNYHDADPAISPDGKELYFASERYNLSGPSHYDRDIWVSQWDSDKNIWKTPENLDDYNIGLKINSEAKDQDPSFSSDSRHLFFISNKLHPNSDDHDIYWYAREKNDAGTWGSWNIPLGLNNLIHPPAPVNTEEEQKGIDMVNDALYLVIKCHPHVIDPLVSVRTTIISIGRYKNAERTVTVRGGLGLIAERTFVPMHWSDQKGVPEQYLYLINSED